LKYTRFILGQELGIGSNMISLFKSVTNMLTRNESQIREENSSRTEPPAIFVETF